MDRELLLQKMALAIHKTDCAHITWQGDSCTEEIQPWQTAAAEAALDSIWPEIEHLLRRQQLADYDLKAPEQVQGLRT